MADYQFIEAEQLEIETKETVAERRAHNGLDPHDAPVCGYPFKSHSLRENQFAADEKKHWDKLLSSTAEERLDLQIDAEN